MAYLVTDRSFSAALDQTMIDPHWQINPVETGAECEYPLFRELR
jgi:hypothetical protein